jgi:hypothetical protein
LNDPKTKCFLGILILHLIFCGLRFWGWFLISVWLNVLCSFSMIICSMLVMIGHVRKMKYTREL